MRQRDVALSIVFTIITCGIYGVYWFICLTNEMNEAVGEEDTSGGLAFVFTLITCGIYGIYWAYKMGGKLNQARQIRGMSVDSSTGILYLILMIFGLGIVVYALAQDGLNKMAQE